MAGLYTEGESKVLSGVYSLIIAISTSITSGGRGIVAYPFTADWGPVNELTAGNLRELRDNAKNKALYGNTQYYEEISDKDADLNSLAAEKLASLSKITSTLSMAGVNSDGAMGQAQKESEVK